MAYPRSNQKELINLIRIFIPLLFHFDFPLRTSKKKKKNEGRQDGRAVKKSCQLVSLAFSLFALWLTGREKRLKENGRTDSREDLSYPKEKESISR